MTFAARDYQIEGTQKVWEDFERYQAVMGVAATGMGKGHPVNTEIPTPTGWRFWGDLKAKDQVIGRDGKPVVVTHIFDRGQLPTYRVTLSDESFLDVDKDHLWAVRDSEQPSRPWRTLTTMELMCHELKRNRGWRFHIPMASAAHYETCCLPLDPYVVGSLISNGGMTTSGTVLTTPDIEVVERVRSAGIVATQSMPERTDICPRFNLPGLVPITRRLGLREHSTNKRIPPIYLSAGLTQRVALLHGLMDGDGSNRGETRRSVGYYTSSPGLAEDVRELVNSLGGTGIIKRYDRKEKGIDYVVRILLPSGIVPFGTARKGAEYGRYSVRNLQPKRAIISIEPIGLREIRCITVDAQDSLYLVTRNYIVSHNTTMAAMAAKPFLSKGRILVLAHQDQLLVQAQRTFEKLLGCRSQIEMADQWADKKVYGEQILLSTIQTQIAGRDGGRMTRFDPNEFSFVFVDEAHHLAAKSWIKVLRHYLQNPNLRMLLLTATPGRADKLALGQIAQKVSFEYDINYGLENGWLVPVDQYPVYCHGLDLSHVRVTAGELNGAELEAELENNRVVLEMKDAILEKCGDESTLIFTRSSAQTQAFVKYLNAAKPGSAEFVDKDTPREYRGPLYERHIKGAFQYLVNMNIAKEGFDDPPIRNVFMSVPHLSRWPYEQKIGRGTRPLPGVVDGLGSAQERRLAIANSPKPRMTVYDVCGNVGKHVLIRVADILGGRATPEAVKLAKKTIDKGGKPADVATELRKAETEIQRRASVKEEALKVAAMRIKASYTLGEKVSVGEVLNGLGMRPCQEPPWLKGKKASDKQRDRLMQLKVIPPVDLSMAQASAMISELIRRRTSPTPPMQAILVKRGLWKDGMTRQEAGRLIREIAQREHWPARPPRSHAEKV